MMEGAPPPAPPPPLHLNDPSPLWFPGLMLATDGMSDNTSSPGAEVAALSNEGRHSSTYRKGTTSHNNNNKRSMPSADNELALCSNLAHLDLRRVAESLSRQHNGGSIGSVASTTSTESNSTSAAFDSSMDDDGSVNYGRMRKRRRHSRTHNAYGGLDFQGILQSLFQRGEGDGNQPSTVPTSSTAGGSGAEGAPSAMMSGNIMEELASPQHF